MIEIRYNGPKHVIRVVGKYEWSKRNRQICEVDAVTARSLLWLPDNEFSLVEEEKVPARKAEKRRRVKHDD